VKRQILDQLDELYQFDTPETLVDAEFNNIWTQITRDLEQSGKSFEDEDTTEEAAREEYRKLAERRVRLGLVLSEIGEKAGVKVADEEMQRALYEQVRQFPGQERQIMEYFQKTPGAAASLRAPIFEEKVIDHLLSEAEVTDKTVSKEELMAEDEDETGSKAEASEKKPAKKKAAKKDETAAADEGEKKPAKKKAAKKDDAEEA
jgi:trigger factor